MPTNSTSALLESRFPLGSYHRPHRDNFPDPVDCRTWRLGRFGVEEVPCLPSDLPDGYVGRVVMRLVDSENIVIDLALGDYGEEYSFRATYVLPR
jgi:hypothetical protein